MSNFTVFKQEVSFLESSDRYYFTTIDQRLAMQKADRDFMDFYRKCGNISTALDHYMDEAEAIVHKRALRVLFDKLPNAGIYDITEKKFCEDCCNLDEAVDAYNDIVDEYNDIVSELAMEKALREERKNSRGHWQGGGFGLKGAIKGAATAGALNMASGLGHSLINAVGNASSESNANNEKANLYRSEDTIYTLSKGVRLSVFDSYVEYIVLVNEYYPDEVYFSNNEFDKEKATALFENAKKFPDKREELLLDALRVCPYYDELLAYIFENYPEERKTISEMADYYRVDISLCYEKIFAQQYNQADWTDEGSLLKAKAEILADMEKFGVNRSKSMSSLDTQYMQLVCDKYYKTAPVGERTEALEKIKAFDTSANLRKEIIQNNDLWELSKVSGASFDVKSAQRIVINEYKELKKQNASDDRIEAVLGEIATSLGVYDLKEKQRSDIFVKLCDDKPKASANTQLGAKEKEEVLAPVFKYWEKKINSFAFNERSYLVYKKGEAHKLANQQGIVKLESGEYIVLMFLPNLSGNDRYKKRFCRNRQACGCNRVWFYQLQYCSWCNCKIGLVSW